MTSNHTKMTLLTTGNPKIAKGMSLGYLTNILHLAPYKLSGRNVCPMATAGCAAACLNTAGRGGIIKKGETTNQIQIARLARTDFFFNDREQFMGKLVKEITNAIKLAEKHELTPVFRLNGTSDIRWETVPVVHPTNTDGFDKPVVYNNIMEMFPNVQFYDYTKIANRRDLPANYHLTFSLAESNLEDALLALAHGMNVAAVFRTVPDTFLGVSVIDGDATDLRFLDPRSVVVGLKAKGKAKKDTSGFVY
jgi:hypothetical protein